MHRSRIVLTGLIAALGLALAGPAQADDAPPAGGVPLTAPPAPRQVPVPDIRGMGESEARRALAEAGLTIGGIERVAPDRLQQEFGRAYDAGTVVQQAPPPSIADRPSWLSRGAPVWLRIAAASAQAATPMRDAVPSRPPTAVPVYGTTQPPPNIVRELPYTSGGSPSRPPPPYALTEGSPFRAPPQAYVPAPQSFQPGSRIDAPGATPGGATPPQLTRTPAPVAAQKRKACYTLSCDRKENGFHVRLMGGAAFYAGDDSSDVGGYGGIDLGYTMCQCFGLDVFYRYAGGTFDRNLPNGLLEDSGDFHHVGVKATFDKTFNDTSRLYWWAGLGVGYFKSRRFQVDDDGLAGYGEFGLGYMLSNAIRLRLGLNLHVMDTVTGRLDPGDDASGRLYWTIAPVLGVEIDL